MRGAVVLSVTAVLLGLAPPDCGKLLGKKAAPAAQDEPSTPPPLPAPTPPPVWNPPEAQRAPATPAPTSAPPASSPELTKALSAAAVRDHKKVRALLEKKVRAGQGTAQEAQLVRDACEVLRDKACLDAVARAKVAP